MNSKQYKSILDISIISCVVISIISIMCGNVFISPADIINFIFSDGTGTYQSILLYSRIPRTFAALFAGAALSVSGAILQNVLSNKLASPSIIGVNAGAALGVSISCGLGLLSGWAISTFSFIGSLLAVFIISIFARSTSASKTTVVLGGVALNSILNAFNESLSVLNPDISVMTTEFRVGGFSAISYTRLLPAFIMIAISLIVLFTLLNELDVVSLGDETATSIGLSVKKYRVIFLVISALLAGAAVSFAGLLGFIGLIVPHFVRNISCNESRYMIPLCAIIGGSFVCLCDLISRIMFMPYELPVGIIMSIIGAPIFINLLVKLKGGHSND